ncbi:MAG: AAA family ATPase [Clostridia bacterium]|nr:AAA family ATPase [Clostridia bacterium]
MGTYVNPGYMAFSRIAGNNYVDKTKLIHAMNERIGGDKSLVCVSRPRRFGKSYAASMLSAYYDCSCDSRRLFDDKIIAGSDSYEDHINKYNVIYLDVTGFISEAKRLQKSLEIVPIWIVDAIMNELPEEIQGITPNDRLLEFVKKTGKQIVFIIDEWDAMIREAKDNTNAQKAYLTLLRSWFNDSNFTPKAVSAAYMTGILPIKKVGSQSAISAFDESSMLDPLEFSGFIGFTEEEVAEQCRGGKVEFAEINAWYDGYDLPGVGHVYNPYSVMKALKSGKCQSYWRKTSSAGSLIHYINMDFEGLPERVARLSAGERIPVNVDSFQNDFETFGSADDILTLLIHLGYLTYHEAEQTVEIPNEEVRKEFKDFLSQRSISNGWMPLIKRSQKLLEDTIAERSEDVAAAMEEIRAEQYAPQFYNNEQSLRAIIKYAYFVTASQYTELAEIPGGKGIADVSFIPAPLSRLPAMVVELKWNKTAGGAISQIKEKKYMAKLKPYAGNILLVGINYDEKTGKHTCLIEKA